VLKGARSARISEGEVKAFEGHVSALLQSPTERETLSKAGSADARTWDAPALMSRAMDLYTILAKVGSGDAMYAGRQSSDPTAA